MELDDIYDLVIDSVRQALAEENGGGDIQISARMSGGHVIFEDGDARVVKKMAQKARLLGGINPS